jgi:hypothetical protein
MIFLTVKTVLQSVESVKSIKSIKSVKSEPSVRKKNYFNDFIKPEIIFDISFDKSIKK